MPRLSLRVCPIAKPAIFASESVADKQGYVILRHERAGQTVRYFTFYHQQALPVFIEKLLDAAITGCKYIDFQIIHFTALPACACPHADR